MSIILSCSYCKKAFESEGNWCCDLCLDRRRATYKRKIEGRGYLKVHRNLLGEVFGDLTVVEALPKGTFLRKTWRCKCVCGNFTLAETRNLTRFPNKKCTHTVLPMDTTAKVQ